MFDPGTMSVWRRQGTEWSQTTRLNGSGITASISGDYAVIGTFHFAFGGIALAFRREDADWVPMQPLPDDTPMHSHGVGRAVRIAGDRTIVGTTDSAFVFQRQGSNWLETGALSPSNAAGDFGAAVAISGDYALVGAPATDGEGNASGAAYVFQWQGDGWIQTRKLLPGNAARDFGRSVALSGDYALVGASREDEPGAPPGTAYVYRRQGTDWVEAQRLTAGAGIAGDAFSYEVALDGPYAVVGAPLDREYGESAGAAYVYRRQDDEWIEIFKLTAGDAAPYDQFGRALALSGDCVLVGAPSDDNLGINSGAVYMYELTPAATCTSPDALPTTPGDPPAPGDDLAFISNYPNPFSRQTTLEYRLAEAAHVTIAIYEVLGREVQVLMERPRPAGVHTLTWEAAALPAGLYLVRIMMDRGESRVLPVVKR